jgi:hypothetical protein
MASDVPTDVWAQHIRQSSELAARGNGPNLVAIVSGTNLDRTYWQHRLARTAPDVFASDGRFTLVPIAETEPKGNFLGTINAWREIRQRGAHEANASVGLISMVFGKGIRFSPFTQALGNRKPAFPTLRFGSRVSEYLCTADLSNLFCNSWVSHLTQSGFKGMIVKWGDEAIIPGALWTDGASSYADVDAIRFVWETQPNDALAREKEWLAYDRRSHLVSAQFPRQSLDSLRRRVGQIDRTTTTVGVNLGSLAISTDFLNALLETFSDDLDTVGVTADWDPYTWIALFCATEANWRGEKALEQQVGLTGIQQLEERFPNFYQRVAHARATLERRLGRPVRVKALEFGLPLWLDFGLHEPLRRNLDLLVSRDPQGDTLRMIFGIPELRDDRGNTIIRSEVHPSADVRDSLLLDSVIGAGSVVRNAVVARTRVERLEMTQGGAVLFSVARQFTFNGPHAIAFRVFADSVELEEGERRTTLLHPERPIQLRGSEEITDLKGANYTSPILGNSVSYEEAGDMMAAYDGIELDDRWTQVLSGTREPRLPR